jgi:hypothetical protein
LCLAVVGGIYGMPVIATVLLGIFGSGASDGTGLIGTRTVDERTVHWEEVPLLEAPDDDAVAADEDEEDDSDASDEPDPPEASDPLAPVADVGPPVPGDSTDAVADAESTRPDARGRQVANAKRQALARARARADARAKRAKRELTAKEKRKIERRKRKRERMAKRKQCDELSDQILQVSDDEWWFGREIANCYRTHLEQFDRLGGAWWKKDENGKSIGVGLSVSRSRRGEPARRAGFKTGDVIQSVNGLKVRNWGGVTIAATQLARKRVRLKMIRDGEKQTITLRVVSLDALVEKRMELEAVAEAPPTGPDR